MSIYDMIAHGGNFNPVGSYIQGQQVSEQMNQNRLANMLTQMKMQQAQQAQANKNKLATLLPSVMQGDKQAMQQAAAIDPESTAKYVQLYGQMNEQQRKQEDYRLEQTGRLLMTVKNAPEDQKQQAYSWARQQALQLGADPASIPEQYDPAHVEMSLGRVLSVKDQISQSQGSYGQPIQAIGPDGKPTFVQVDKGGNMRPLSGYAPVPKPGMSITTPDGTVVQLGGVGSDLQKSTLGKIEGKQVDAVEQLVRLNNIAESFKPEFLTYGAGGKVLWSRIKEKGGADLSPEEKKYVMEFSRFKRDSISNVNRTLNEISGAAVNEHEAVRIRAELPDPGTGLFDGDAATEFKAKLDGATRNLKRAIIRYNYAKKQGIDPLKSGVELADVDALVERRGNELETLYKQRMPGVDDSVIKLQVRDQLAKEFGLE